MDFLKGKKIAIVGKGVNNQKLSEYLQKHNLEFTIIEWKSTSDLIGKLDEFDIVFRTPGFPYLSEAIQQAKKSGVEISSQTKLFFDLCPAKIIGVTGTKGKGTTASLIAKILEAGDHKVWLAGNIGSDPFEFLDFIHPEDLVVLELSSFQLQDLHKSPHVAVVLNITADHLDESGTYEKSAHASIKEYFDAKMQILAFQSQNDFAVLSKLLPSSVAQVGLGKKIYFMPEDVLDFDYQLVGDFWKENIAAANAVAKIFNVPEPKVRKAVAEFKGLPHRMQLVGTFDDITYIDNSMGTNVDTAVFSITAFETPLIVIVGGSSKGLDYTELGNTIKSRNVKGVVVVGEETDKILKSLDGYEGTILTGAKNMSEIVAQAKSIAAKGDTVLLSPAAASFDMFKDYADRGRQFKEEVIKA